MPLLRWDRSLVLRSATSGVAGRPSGVDGIVPMPAFLIGRQRRGSCRTERHLWPAFFWLIEQCRPDLVFGEQVAGKAGESWFDLVRTDLEGVGYAAGLSVFPACGVGASTGGCGSTGLEKVPWEKSPTASDGEGGMMEIKPGTTVEYKLRDFVQLGAWATPKAHDAKGETHRGLSGSSSTSFQDLRMGSRRLDRRRTGAGVANTSSPRRHGPDQRRE